jgi:MoxR-like ATPase
MKIRIVTELEPLAQAVCEVLEEKGFEVEIVDEAVRSTEIRYAEGVSIDAITQLIDSVKPLLPSVTLSDKVDDDAVELRLGEVKDLEAWELKIYADSEDFAETLRGDLMPMGFTDDGTSLGHQDANVLKYGGATAFARQVIRYVLAKHGVRVTEEKAWGNDDNDVWVYVRDPRYDGQNLKECFPLEIIGDDVAQMLALQAHLRTAGYAQVGVRSLDPDQTPRFMVEPGPFRRDEGEQSVLVTTVRAFLHGKGIDADRYPLELGDGDTMATAQIMLPMGAHEGGTLRPTAGAFSDRWQVVIRTDDAEAAEPLKAQLTAAGYVGVTTAPLPSGAFGFQIRWGAARKYPEVADYLKGTLEKFIGELGAPSVYTLATSDALDEDDPKIEIDLPTQGLDEEGMERRIKGACSNWELTVKAARLEDFDTLVARLRALSFKSFDTENEASVSEPIIQYGGAPPAVVEYIASMVHRATGVRCETKKIWDTDDDDIWISLPARDTIEVEDAPEAFDLSAWFADGPSPTGPEPFLTVSADSVSIAGMVLPRRTGTNEALVPPPEMFSHYCLDQRTAETLMHVAESVVLREPCLLEGETSVSKTSIIQYLAHLVNQPVVRLNLNGQTDTGELVGRFLPQESVSHLPVPVEELYEVMDLLEPETRTILERSRSASRELSRAEIQQVMANEQMSQHPWRWQDGLVLSAMKHGWWVILDELNLAEPQILERLNSVLERNPSIVITENNNEVIGHGGIPVHPNFRIFATMNPAEYAGRSPLSPAYRDRWRGYNYVSAPGEAEYHSMLRYLVYGTQPDVTVRGWLYRGHQGTPSLGTLADLPEVQAFLRALARFHAALEGAVGRQGGRSTRMGGRRKDRYVFTRRGLLSVMDYLASVLATGRARGSFGMRAALLRYYIGRVSSPADQQIIVQLLDAAGIGPNTWQLGQPDSEG